MAIYEKRLQADLTHIREQVGQMGEMAQKTLENAIHALLTGNHQLANDTVLADHPINRKMREIDHLCHGFIARHLPSGRHLRLISSIIRINIELERIGDYAVTISREALQLGHPLQGLMADETTIVAKEARLMLHQALSAFYADSAEKAKATQGMSGHLEFTLDGIYGHLMSGEYTQTNKDMFAIFAVLTQLKRTADQAKNICEETVFAVTGETKSRKVYKILFIDRHNSSLGPMAEAIARHNHPNSGRYSSAGAEPAQQMDPALSTFLDGHGMGLEDLRPKALELSFQELADYQVVISLQGPVRDYFSSVPFHTAYLDWDLGEPPEGLTRDAAEKRYAEIHRELSFRIRDLMELLRGEGAD